MEESKETPFFYGPNEVKAFAEKRIAFKDLFLGPTIKKFLETEAPGKRILDIGCGTGIWCYEAARYGAERIDGFDKQEKMVELAKQATAQCNTVSIQLGDVMNMPYDDNTFDIALSLFVTCELPIEILPKHFKELHRVLIPGGKALVLNLTNQAFQVNLTDGANEVVVQKEIDQALASIPNRPTQQQISKAFEDLCGIIYVSFAYDENGSLFQVKDVNQLVNGQVLVRKSYITTFPDFYYNDQFIIDQTISTGLSIDRIENAFTEERRMMHNTLNPEVPFSKRVVDHPFYLLHHISKPT